MRRAIYLIVILAVLVCPVKLMAFEERDLPDESAAREKVGFDELKEHSIIFEGYINTKDVTVVADVIGAVFHFCKDDIHDFCSDRQGILIIGADDGGKIIDILKRLEEAMENGDRVMVYLSKNPYYAGAKRIIDIEML